MRYIVKYKEKNSPTEFEVVLDTEFLARKLANTLAQVCNEVVVTDILGEILPPNPSDRWQK